MAAELLHYRAWHGQLHRPFWSVWPIARVALTMMFRRKLFWFMYALGLMIFLMFFFGQYLLTWAGSQMGEDVIPVAGFPARPGQIITFLGDRLKLNGSAETFRNFFWYQGSMVMVILALAGSIVVGNDVQFRSLPFYLSKPLAPWHYLLGKFLAVAVFVNLMTTLPAMVLYVQYGMLESWDYLITRWDLLRGILGYGAVLTICLSIMLVAAASWLRRTVPLIMAWTTVFFFCRLLAAALVEGLKYDVRWRLIDLWNNMYLLGNACLGIAQDTIRPAPQPALGEAVLVLIGVCTLCLTYLTFRIRTVEIVR